MQAQSFFHLPRSLGSFASFFPAEVPPLGLDLSDQGGPCFLATPGRCPPRRTASGGAHGGPGSPRSWRPASGDRDLDWPGVDRRGDGDPAGRVHPRQRDRGRRTACLGNACEFKNCLLMDGVQVPHFSYVGDSILGNGAHLGAGVVLLQPAARSENRSWCMPTGRPYETGLRKFGAILG
jgi:hypothetical protein